MPRDSLRSSADNCVCCRAAARLRPKIQAKQCGGPAPERRIEQGGICVETYAPDSQRPAGLLANLQVARAAIFLMERNDFHTDILGKTNPRNQAVEVARAVLSLTHLARSSHLDTVPSDRIQMVSRCRCSGSRSLLRLPRAH